MSDQPNPTLKRLLGAYMKLRSKRSQLSRQFKEADSKLKDVMSQIEVQLMRMMKDIGSDNLSIKGTAIAYMTTKTYTKGKDWDALWKYIEESGNIDLLARKINAKAVQEYRDVNDDALPPGVDVYTEREIVVRTA